MALVETIIETELENMNRESTRRRQQQLRRQDACLDCLRAKFKCILILVLALVTLAQCIRDILRDIIHKDTETQLQELIYILKQASNISTMILQSSG